jgi:hypothetical protein
MKFMPNPEKQTTWCGLCKCRRLKAHAGKSPLEAIFSHRFNSDWTAKHETSLLGKMVAKKRESIAEMARRRGLTPVSRGVEKWTDDSLLKVRS